MSGELRRIQINDINRDLFKDLIVNEFITCSKITGNIFPKFFFFQNSFFLNVSNIRRAPRREAKTEKQLVITNWNTEKYIYGVRFFLIHVQWISIGQIFNSSIIHFTNGQFSNSLIYRLKDHLQLVNSSIFQNFLLGSLIIGQFFNHVWYISMKIFRFFRNDFLR